MWLSKLVIYIFTCGGVNLSSMNLTSHTKEEKRKKENFSRHELWSGPVRVTAPVLPEEGPVTSESLAFFFKTKKTKKINFCGMHGRFVCVCVSCRQCCRTICFTLRTYFFTPSHIFFYTVAHICLHCRTYVFTLSHIFVSPRAQT